MGGGASSLGRGQWSGVGLHWCRVGPSAHTPFARIPGRDPYQPELVHILPLLCRRITQSLEQRLLRTLAKCGWRDTEAAGLAELHDFLVSGGTGQPEVHSKGWRLPPCPGAHIGRRILRKLGTTASFASHRHLPARIPCLAAPPLHPSPPPTHTHPLTHTHTTPTPRLSAMPLPPSSWCMPAAGPRHMAGWWAGSCGRRCTPGSLRSTAIARRLVGMQLSQPLRARQMQRPSQGPPCRGEQGRRARPWLHGAPTHRGSMAPRERRPTGQQA